MLHLSTATWVVVALGSELVRFFKSTRLRTHARSRSAGGLAGRRPDCKSCHNDYHNRWVRRRYVPKTGRRYRTRRDREAAAAAGAPNTSL